MNIAVVRNILSHGVHATLGLLTVLLRTFFPYVRYGMSGAVDAFAPLSQKRVYLENFFKR